MKTITTLFMISLLGIMFIGCSGSIEQYKPLYQVKPDKKTLKSGE